MKIITFSFCVGLLGSDGARWEYTAIHLVCGRPEALTGDQQICSFHRATGQVSFTLHLHVYFGPNLFFSCSSLNLIIFVSWVHFLQLNSHTQTAGSGPITCRPCKCLCLG